MSGRLKNRKADGTKWNVKLVIESPFAATWPDAVTSPQQAVVALQDAVEWRASKRGGRRLRRQPREPGDNASEQPDKKLRPTPRRHPQRAKPDGLVFGLNEVTRALEKSKLKLVVASRDVKPALMVQHIPVLCYMKHTDLVSFPGDGTELGAAIGLKRMLAIGVRKGSNIQLIDNMKPFVNNPEYPWLAKAHE